MHSSSDNFQCIQTKSKSSVYGKVTYGPVKETILLILICPTLFSYYKIEIFWQVLKNQVHKFSVTFNYFLYIYYHMISFLLYIPFPPKSYFHERSSSIYNAVYPYIRRNLPFESWESRNLRSENSVLSWTKKNCTKTRLEFESSNVW